MDRNLCPDCGEKLIAQRGIVPLRAIAACPSCLWNEVQDEPRGANATEDWLKRHRKEEHEQED